MAYDIGIVGTYPGRPAFNLYLYVRRDVTDAPNRRSTYAWALYARNPSGSSATFAVGPFPWSVNVGGQIFSGSSGLDFRGGQTQLVLGAGTTGWISHDTNGALSIVVDAWHGPASIFGTADPAPATFVTDRIPAAPGVPGRPSASAIASSTAQLSWTAAARGNANIDLYQYQIAADAGFVTVLQTLSVGNVLTGPVSSLNAGVEHHARVRAHNGDGWGPWSAVRSFRTLASAYVGKGGAFVPAAEVRAGAAGALVADIRVGKGGSYVPAG